MARILTISSDVVRGHVGNAAAVFALQRLGHEVWSLPTVVLSNHPGHPHMGGLRIPPETASAMLDALDANGWLASLDAVTTGYLPTPEHVSFAAKAIDRARARAPQVQVLVDPVLGDEPKGLYIEADAAVAIRETLLDRADIVTPNAFELRWLTGGPRRMTRAALRDMVRALEAPTQLVTGLPLPSRAHVANALLSHEGATCTVQARRPEAPHGTGDLLAALLLGHLLPPRSLKPEAALAAAVGALNTVLSNTGQRDELALAQGGGDWVNSRPWQTMPLATLNDQRLDDDG